MTQKNRHLVTITLLCWAVSSQLRHVSAIGNKLVKQQYLLHTSHNLVNFSPLAAGIDWRVWGPQQISTAFASWLRYCRDVAQLKPSKLCTTLAVSWAGRLLDCVYLFCGCCPVMEFCQVQNSLCIRQVLHCPILAALVHGTAYNFSGGLWQFMAACTSCFSVDM